MSEETNRANPGQPTIRKGATGAAVKWLQRALNRSSEEFIVPDGVFGPVTEAALQKFQRGAGLEADGIAGPMTWAALPNGGPMPLLREGSHGQVVFRLEEVLRDSDFRPGDVDGTFDARTKSAVMELQRVDGIESDGIVADLTWQSPIRAECGSLEGAVGLEFAQA